MEHLHELVLLVNGEIVRFIWGQTADLPHDTAQFLPGLLELLERFDLDLDFIIRAAPKSRDKLFDGNNDLVVEADKTQETSLFLEDADDFECPLVYGDFIAERRFPLEKIRSHLGTDDANGPAALDFRRG